ncbi:NADPH-dependent 1-acyldihydroxyacetone phosphate reductase-like, partial [Olea europaea subsp. europaea]
MSSTGMSYAHVYVQQKKQKQKLMKMEAGKAKGETKCMAEKLTEEGQGMQCKDAGIFVHHLRREEVGHRPRIGPCVCLEELSGGGHHPVMSDFQDDPRFFLQKLDVSSGESVFPALSIALEKRGRIDIVVNNARVECIGPLAEVPLSAIEQTINTNLY